MSVGNRLVTHSSNTEPGSTAQSGAIEVRRAVSARGKSLGTPIQAPDSRLATSVGRTRSRAARSQTVPSSLQEGAAAHQTNLRHHILRGTEPGVQQGPHHRLHRRAASSPKRPSRLPKQRPALQSAPIRSLHCICDWISKHHRQMFVSNRRAELPRACSTAEHRITRTRDFSSQPESQGAVMERLAQHDV